MSAASNAEAPIPVLATRKGSPLPAGAMIELAFDNISEGKLMLRTNAKIKSAIKQLLQYEDESKDTGGQAVVTIKIKIGRMKKSKEYFDVKHVVKVETPSLVESSFVKDVNGHLLVQPTGSSLFDPDQQVIFDAKGRVIGGTDPETGEIMQPEPTIAGRIGK
jgi:hypothetical protein